MSFKLYNLLGNKRIDLYVEGGWMIDSFDITNLVSAIFNNNEMSISFLDRNEFSIFWVDGMSGEISVVISSYGQFPSEKLLKFYDGLYVNRIGKKIVTLAPNNNFLPTRYSVTTNIEKVKKFLRLFVSTVNSIVVGLARNISSDESSGEIVNSNLLNINSDLDEYSFEFISNANTTNVNGIYVKCSTNNGDVYFYKKFPNDRTFNLNQGDKISTSISLPWIDGIYV